MTPSGFYDMADEGSWQSDVLRSPHPGVPWARDLAVITVLFGLIFLVCFSHRPLANPDEGRYAEIPREMLATGDWVTPRLDGVKYFEKPPLVYWTNAVAFTLFGRAEWSVRLPTALFALVGVLFTYAVARKIYGRAAGLTAATVLLSSLLYFFLSGVLLLDMAVSVLMSATLVFFILGVREAPGSTRRWLFYGLYASAALATLTKGLIGFLLPGAVMFFWLLIFNQWRRLLPLYLPTGVALFLAVAAPWHLLAASRNSDWAHFYFVQEHLERFTSKVHDRYEPWWYFAPVVLLGFVPWTGFLWPAFRSLVAGGRARWRRDADSWFFAVWAVFVFLFFSASSSKLIPYVLPVFPPLAVLVGRWRAGAGATNTRGWGVGVGAFLLAATLFAVALVFAVLRPGLIRDEAIRDLARPYAICAAAMLVVGSVAVVIAARTRTWDRAMVVIVCTTLCSIGTLSLAAPRLIVSGTKDLALIVRAQAAPTDVVFHYRGFYHDFTYYAERTVGVVDYVGELELAIDEPARASGRFIGDAEFRRVWAGPGRIWMVVRRSNAESLLADSTFKHHVLGESPRYLLLSNQPTHEPDRHP